MPEKESRNRPARTRILWQCKRGQHRRANGKEVDTMGCGCNNNWILLLVIILLFSDCGCGCGCNNALGNNGCGC